MNIIVVIKDRLENMPPILSAIKLIDELGHRVSVICEHVPEFWQHYYDSHGIKFFVTTSTIERNASRLAKIKSYLSFRKEARHYINNLYSNDKDSLLWIEGPQPITALGISYIKKYRYALMIEELHETSKINMFTFKKVIHGARAIFMPEYNRSILYKVWFGLDKHPYVLPNKPYFLPDKKELEEAEIKYSKIFKDLQGKKIILYQGVIDGVRNLDNYIMAAKKLGDDFIFCLLGPGRGDSVEKLSALWKNVYHVDFIPAPYYLAITAKAYIGIVSYVPNTLNNVFCAPNKMFEYGAFGVPMVGNDIPGLKLIDHKNAGITREDTDIDSIYESYKAIIADHDEYSHNARLLYDSTDNKETIRLALDKI